MFCRNHGGNSTDAVAIIRNPIGFQNISTNFQRIISVTKPYTEISARARIRGCESSIVSSAVTQVGDRCESLPSPEAATLWRRGKWFLPLRHDSRVAGAESRGSSEGVASCTGGTEPPPPLKPSLVHASKGILIVYTIR